MSNDTLTCYSIAHMRKTLENDMEAQKELIKQLEVQIITAKGELTGLECAHKIVTGSKDEQV